MPVALLHSGDAGRAMLFQRPVAELRLPASDWSGAFAALETFLRRHREHRCVVVLAYDLRDDVEALPRQLVDDLEMPCLSATAFAGWQEFDPAPVPPPPPLDAPVIVRAHHTRADYEQRVARVVENIHAGEIFQANLTQPFSARYAGDPRLLFWRLCHASPAPFAAYYESGDEAVLSSSPEEFLWVDGDVVRTRPIKGTRPRGRNEAEDRGLLAELLASDKDRAELLMIVDLLRNDLGKVADTGSVEVGPFPEHASYPHVHHTFATVKARLRQDVGLVDLLRATFPCGSITGAPKLRAMEILEQTEILRRGIYTGSIGWIGPSRRMHLNVAIRTMVLKAGRLRFNTGGGITADSTPAAEFEECLHKAAGILEALGAELPA